MKAERRHELQHNSLAGFLTNLPQTLQTHANKILIGVIVICLVLLLVRHRMNSARDAREMARVSLLSARSNVEQLKVVDQSQPNDLARAQERKKLTEQIHASVDDVLQNTSDSDDAPLRASALVTRGDLYWTLANLNPLAGASTMPASVAGPTTNEALENAESAYTQVVQGYSSQNLYKTAALFGLAAVEENRGNWDKAIDHYNDILKDNAITPVYKEVARERLALIPQVRKPVYIGSFSSTQPATAPATEPTTAPSVGMTMPMPATAPN